MSWSPSELELSRRQVRRQAAWRRGFIGLAASLVVFGCLGWLLFSSPGWPRVKETFFSWADAKESWPTIWAGFWLNVQIFLVAEVAILILGGLIAILRTTTSAALLPFRAMATIYTDVVRGIPTILLVALFGFGIPALNLTGVPNSLVILGGLALVISYSAYVAEVFRAGIKSIHPSQIASAQALGLSAGQTMRHVILPPAVRRVAAPLLNDFVSLQKDTAMVGFLGVVEAMNAAREYSNFNFNYTPYLVAAVLFVLCTVPLARLTDWLAKK